MPNDTTNTQGQNASAEAEKFTLDAIDREYFAPAELEKAVPLLASIDALKAELGDKMIVRRNFDGDKLPDGFGLFIVPITKTEKQKGRINIGAAIAAVPDMDTVAAHEQGMAFITEAVLSAYAVKIGNAVRPRPDGTAAASMPQTIEDFITSRRGREGFKTYNELAADFVAFLKKKGLKTINKVTLRNVLQSTETAKQLYPSVPQELWTNLLDVMVKTATQKKLDPASLVNWKETRDQVGAETVDDLDLSDLQDFLSEDEAEKPAEAA